MTTIVTHRDLEYRIHSRSRGRLDAEHERVKRHLLELSEYVNAEAHYDDRGNMHATRACLDGLEDDEAYSGDDRARPRQRAVNRTPDKRCDADAEHTDEPKEADHESAGTRELVF